MCYNKTFINLVAFFHVLINAINNVVLFELYYLGIYWLSLDDRFDFKSMSVLYGATVFVLIFSDIIMGAKNRNSNKIFVNLITFGLIGFFLPLLTQILLDLNNDQNKFMFIFEVLLIVATSCISLRYLFGKLKTKALVSYYAENTDDFVLVKKQTIYDMDGDFLSDNFYYKMKGFNPFNLYYIE